MAECNLLAGEYLEAAERFKLFVRINPTSERRGEATVLAALCYKSAKDRRNAVAMLESYLTDFKGEYSEFVAKTLAELRAGGAR
jgi:outer membrane protein assembly factor BamD (BamD/ComL family)